MTNYNVIKYFGHFAQYWNVTAKSEQDAWDRAERNGVLLFQSCYKETKDLESKGYVIDLDKAKEEHAISDTEYAERLREAINKGMIVTTREYEKAFGLPFHDV